MTTTTKELLDLLRRHYIKPGAPFPGGTFIPECGINGGAGGSRADALYVGFTSASGRLLVGHELKVSRADWRRELDKVGKADFWADNCHQWWIVAPGPEVVPKEELPHGWGLMYPSTRTKTRMQIVVKAETHADRVPSWLAVRSIMARLDTLRVHHDTEVRQKAREAAQEEAREQQAQLAAREAGRTLTAAQREQLDAFARIEKALGCSIEGYVWDESGDKISAETAAAAIRLVLDTKGLGLEQDRFALQSLQRAAKKLTEGLDGFEEARKALLQLTGRAVA